jgi:hypothetical protein
LPGEVLNVIAPVTPTARVSQSGRFSQALPLMSAPSLLSKLTCRSPSIFIPSMSSVLPSSCCGRTSVAIGTVEPLVDVEGAGTVQSIGPRYRRMLPNPFWV